MSPDDIRKLLGGYATGTLTAAEQEALFTAALEDQELFDALMKEESLRELLRDPAARSELLAALEREPERVAWWRWRPLIGALAMAGIGLAAVAVWRGTREKPAPVMIAEVRKESAPAVAPPTPPKPAPDTVVAPRTSSKPANRPQKTDAVRPAPGGIGGAIAEATPPVLKGEAQAAPPAPPAAARAPEPMQQVGQLTAPSPRVQQQQQQSQPAVASNLADRGAPPVVQPAVTPPAPKAEATARDTKTMETVSAEAALARARVVSGSGFREQAAALDLAAAKKVAPLLQWTILRGDRESPPATVLDDGETVRLRIVSQVSGTLTLLEGEKVLASAKVEAARPFDSPPIPFTASGDRQLRLTVSSGATPPLTLAITLHYAP